MRMYFLLTAITMCVVLSSGCANQQPQPAAPTAQPAPAPAPAAPAGQVSGDLRQVMRGILFPNANVIFFAQDKNPADTKPAKDPSLATDPLASAYGGWTAVENSGVALAEAANLLTIPGRLCSNGRAVPVQSDDWKKLVQGLRDAGMSAYKAAQSKDKDKIVDAAGNVTTACSDCHDKYREKPGGEKDRCM
jgi:hypothetical protein